MICATPGLPLAPCVSDGHATVEPLPSVHEVGAATARKWVKFWVVPEPSERCATVMGVLGSLAFGFSCLISTASHVLIWREKILAIVSAESCSFTPGRLYDTVIGPPGSGK